MADHQVADCQHEAYEVDSAGQPVRCSDCEEAPAEAGELDRAVKRMRNQLVGSATFASLMFGREDVRLVLDTLSALRTQPQAREEAQPVVWTGDPRKGAWAALASYCGDDTEGCTDLTPCIDCLKMVNVFEGRRYVCEMGAIPALSTPPAPEADKLPSSLEFSPSGGGKRVTINLAHVESLGQHPSDYGDEHRVTLASGTSYRLRKSDAKIVSDYLAALRQEGRE